MDNGEDFSQSAYSFSSEVAMLRNQVASLETDKMIFGVALEQSIEKINELRAEISGEKDLERFHDVVTATKEAAVAAGIKLDAWLHGGPDRGSEVPPPRISDSTMMSAASMASKSDAASWTPASSLRKLSALTKEKMSKFRAFSRRKRGLPPEGGGGAAAEVPEATTGSGGGSAGASSAAATVDESPAVDPVTPERNELSRNDTPRPSATSEVATKETFPTTPDATSGVAGVAEIMSV